MFVNVGVNGVQQAHEKSKDTETYKNDKCKRWQETTKVAHKLERKVNSTNNWYNIMYRHNNDHTKHYFDQKKFLFSKSSCNFELEINFWRLRSLLLDYA